MSLSQVVSRRVARLIRSSSFRLGLLGMVLILLSLAVASGAHALELSGLS